MVYYRPTHCYNYIAEQYLSWMVYFRNKVFKDDLYGFLKQLQAQLKN